MRRAGPLLVLAGLVAGCSSAPDVPSGVRATELVWCADTDGVVDTVTWQGHDGPLTELDVRVVPLAAGSVSEADLLDACARPFRSAVNATLCEASAAPDGLDRYAATGSVSRRYGDAGADRPGFPVVVRGRTACEDLVLDAGPAAAVARANDAPIADQLRGWGGTERFNGWRAREELLTAAADDGCLDIASARQLALDAQRELAGDWLALETASDADDPGDPGRCFDVRLRREGFIEVSDHAVATP